MWDSNCLGRARTTRSSDSTGAAGELYVDRSHSGRTSFSKEFPARIAAPLRTDSPKLRLEILADRNSLEVFADGGHVVLTNLVFPEEDAYGLETFSSNPASRSRTRSLDASIDLAGSFSPLK